MSSRTVAFVRDDDFGDATPALRAFAAEFVCRGIPVNYMLVPAFLTAEGSALARELKRAHPELICLNQHGYRHEQILGGEHSWSEFQGGRPYEDQLSDIARGKEIMRDSLGDAFDDGVFTPPEHKYDENTVRALSEQGFRVLSASTYSSFWARLYYRIGRTLRRTRFLGKRVSYHGGRTPCGRMLEISAAIDVDMDRDARGIFIKKSAAQLLGEFEAARRIQPIVGLMFHHETYEDRSKFETLRAFVDTLIADPSVEFQCIESIAADLFAASA